MKKIFTLMAASLLTLSAMAQVYKVDPSKEIKVSAKNLDGVIGILTNVEGTKVFSLGGGSEWDITSIDLSAWGSKFADYNYVLFELVEEGIEINTYKIRMAKSDKTFYTPSWAQPAGDGCINFQPYPKTGVFVGGNKDQGGTDDRNHGLFDVRDDDNGYIIKNAGPGFCLVPGIGIVDGVVPVKLYSALAIDYSGSVEAAYKAVPANIQNAAVEAAYATAKATPTKANLDALEAAIANINKTAAITNPGIDGNANGWTCQRPLGGGGPMKPSNDALEFWAGSASSRSAAEFNYYQDLTVPNGKYVLQAEMFNSSNGEEGEDHEPNGHAGLYAISGSKHEFVGVTTDSDVLAAYATDVITVEDGKLRIGVKNEGYMSARWFVVDNFSLWYAGDLPTGIKENVAATADVKNNGIYNLAGQQMKRLVKGINIVNGKKIMK